MSVDGTRRPAFTEPYLHADITIKEKALARVQPCGTLLAFLDSLLPSPAGSDYAAPAATPSSLTSTFTSWSA
jgi:hypothetical protein